MPVDISAPPAFLYPSLDENTENNVFPLSSSCLLKLNKGSITDWSVDGRSDAIVLPQTSSTFPFSSSLCVTFTCKLICHV